MYTGLTGKISYYEKTSTDGVTPPVFSENVIGYISNWSIEDTADIIEFAELGGASSKPGHKIKRSGLQSWSASADGAVSFEGKNQKKLFELKSARQPLKLRLYLSENAYFSGKGYIESLSVDLSAEDKGNISISISGDKKLRLYVNETCVNKRAGETETEYDD